MITIYVPTYMFKGSKDLYDHGMKFKLSNLNQRELEQIFENIKILNVAKPTKKQFICLKNQI
jgi:hypothetical protein